MELQLLNAALASRDSLYLILDYIAAKDYSREFQILLPKIKEYYDRDAAANSVNYDVIVAQLEQSLANKKHLKTFTSLIDEAKAVEVSVANIDKLILDAKKYEVRSKLAVALANNDEKLYTQFLGEFNELQHYDSLEDLTAKGVEILTFEDYDAIMDKQFADEGNLILYPRALNDRVKKKLRDGHHIVTFAQTNLGKTALNLTISTGFCRQGARGLYFLNEDRNEDVWERAISCFTGLTDAEIQADPVRAKALADQYGMRNFILIGVSPGNPKQIEALIDKYRPRWFVIDQIRNLDMNDQNKALQLDKASVFGRTMAKKYKCIGVSTTQAGDSATNKRKLEIGDVDWSNVGVQAQADLLIGMGANQEDMERDIRYLTLLKNKLTGMEETFPIKLDRFHSRYTSLGE